MDAHDPYTAPSAALGRDAHPPLPIHHAGRWRRLFNWLIDRAAIMVLGVVVFGPLYGFAPAWVGDWLDGLSRTQEYLLGLPIYVGYYAAMEGLFGITLGKLCTGTRVVDERGHPIVFRHALLRSLCRLIPFDAFSVLMSDDVAIRAWHDSLARTHVVLRRGAVAAETASPAGLGA